MAEISDRRWVQAQLEDGATVTAIADTASVSRQTAYTWIARHGLEPNSPTKPRPTAPELANLYRQLGSAGRVGDRLGVSRDTAQRWLHAAGVDLTAGIDVDVDAARRRAEGATVRQIADEQNVAAETIRRRLAES